MTHLERRFWAEFANASTHKIMKTSNVIERIWKNQSETTFTLSTTHDSHKSRRSTNDEQFLIESVGQVDQLLTEHSPWASQIVNQSIYCTSGFTLVKVREVGLLKLPERCWSWRVLQHRTSTMQTTILLRRNFKTAAIKNTTNIGINLIETHSDVNYAWVVTLSEELINSSMHIRPSEDRHKKYGNDVEVKRTVAKS